MALAIVSCNTADHLALPGTVELSAIAIDSIGQVLERGTRDTLTATVKDRSGKNVVVPMVWRSADEKVATFDRGGVLVAVDTGVTSIVATALGVVSQPVGIRVVWRGPAQIAAGSWTRKNAAAPNSKVSDSLRVVVTNVQGTPVANAKVRFTVVDGGGTVSPIIATTTASGVAATQWTLGPIAGANTVTASVVRDDGSPNPLVANNLVTFSLKSYNALSVESGSGQTAQILSDLAVAPSVKLVDSLGVPRAGVPIIFTAFSNGRVVTPVVSTDANGIASPGTWSLGDIPGQQILEASVEDAQIRISATATGTPIHYSPASVVAGGFSTCAIESGGAVKCWGASPQNGTGAAASVSAPTPVQGSVVASRLSGGPTHYCAITSGGESWCWGLNALVDTSGQTAHTNTPTKVPTDIIWAQVSPGFAHSCGLSTGQVSYCWGDNSSGQLGDQTTTRHLAPTAVSGGFQFPQLSSGVNHTCGLSIGGTAFCWGSNQLGQVGDGTTALRVAPTAVSGGQTFQSIGTGEGITCGLNTQGQAFCWGAISGAAQSTPTPYANAPTFTSVSVGGAHACGLTADGTAYCWGTNTWGQVGDSTTAFRAAPTKVAGGLQFSQISAGYQHTCARTSSGDVACWGRNTAGELGDNTSAFRTTPRYIVLGVNP